MNAAAITSAPAPATARYILLDKAASMPQSCKGQYRRIAIVELDDSGVVPQMISERARGCKRIVSLWDKLSVGKTDRCAYKVALAEAQAELATLNAA